MSFGELSDTLPNTSAEGRSGSIEDWAIYVVDERSDRWRDRIRSHKVRGPLPSDGLLSANADQFDVLVAQLRLGALVPGFPNSFFRILKSARLVFQNLAAVDLSDHLDFRPALYGVAVEAGYIKQLSFSGDVIDGRPEAEFEGVFSWENDSEYAIELLIPLGDGSVGFVSGLPLLSDDVLGKIVVFVGGRDEAEEVREVITARRMLLVNHESEGRWQWIAKYLDDAMIVWPGVPVSLLGDEDFCSIEGLQGYVEMAGVDPLLEHRLSGKAARLAGEIGPFTSVTQKSANADETVTFQTFEASDLIIPLFLRDVGLAVPAPYCADGTVWMLMADELQPLLEDKFGCVFTERSFVLRN